VDQAARELAVRRQTVLADQGRLDLLFGYRKEYEQQLASRSQHGAIDPRQWQNLHGFLGKLDAAITTQQEAVRSQIARADEAHQMWLAADRRLKSVEKLADLRLHRQQLQRARDEQRDHDDLARRGAPMLTGRCR